MVYLKRKAEFFTSSLRVRSVFYILLMIICFQHKRKQLLFFRQAPTTQHTHKKVCNTNAHQYQLLININLKINSLQEIQWSYEYKNYKINNKKVTVILEKLTRSTRTIQFHFKI
ncbi:hypothetical protein EGW08_005411 [Elysia chlorotica]|uniref:Uncharacterized protein n=1 Tax=Elysia chlorotica TaxID=188477 RepID=A0A433TZ34_ELYCH|nr:hypothetical protein EGW08_005411 [Elysia chlorotica]